MRGVWRPRRAAEQRGNVAVFSKNHRTCGTFPGHHENTTNCSLLQWMPSLPVRPSALARAELLKHLSGGPVIDQATTHPKNLCDALPGAVHTFIIMPLLMEKCTLCFLCLRDCFL